MYNKVGDFMKIPKYLKDNDYIGITACSCGVLDKIGEYEESIKRLNNYKIIETNNVRTSGMVSSDKKVRAKELMELYTNKNIKCILVASGGDFLLDMLDEIDYDVIKNNLKWICGYSDPTSLLFSITTKLNIPTIYSPCNSSGLVNDISIDNYLNILKGNLVKQYKRDKYERLSNGTNEYNLEKDNIWISSNDIDISGRLIGGCIDSLKDLIGTKFDNTKKFINKYKDDGIIWYFDVFGLTAECLYNTLIQFKYAGYFDNTKLIVFSKVCYPSTFVGLTYEDAIKNALDGIDYIYKFDFGHIKPSFTMINGFKVRIINNNKESSMEYID